MCYITCTVKTFATSVIQLKLFNARLAAPVVIDEKGKSCIVGFH